MEQIIYATHITSINKLKETAATICHCDFEALKATSSKRILTSNPEKSANLVAPHLTAAGWQT